MRVFIELTTNVFTVGAEVWPEHRILILRPLPMIQLIIEY